jgi:hypothetical protein
VVGGDYFEWLNGFINVSKVSCGDDAHVAFHATFWIVFQGSAFEMHLAVCTCISDESSLDYYPLVDL